MTDGLCAACGRAIDEAARLCPFCGANPRTGEKADTQQFLREIFGKAETPGGGVVGFARQRQGIVVAISGLAGFLLLAGLHHLVTMRNATAVNDSPAIPLTEITDVARAQQVPVTMPELDFQYDGRPRALRTYIVEPGAVEPPPAAETKSANAAAAPAALLPATASPLRPAVPNLSKAPQ